MFHPPHCPNPRCLEHVRPVRRFYVRAGSYRVRRRRGRVPRFRCRRCGTGFSRQTFRPDYRDHRPDLNARVRRLISAGAGLRETSRKVGLSLRCTELKIRKMRLEPAWARRE